MGDRIKRRAYLLVLVLSTVLLVSLTIQGGEQVPLRGLVYPVLAVYNVVLALLVWRRRVSLTTVERLIFVPVVLVLLGFLAALQVAPSLVPTADADLLLVMIWVGVTFPLAFLVLGTRRGLQTSLAILVGFLLLTVPPTLAGDLAGVVSVSTLLSLVGFFGMLVVLLWVLASRLEELAATRARAEVLAVQATTDPLTGLPNRRWLDDELDRHLALVRRHPHPLSAVLIDVDQFKDVNDQFGHDMGDRALVEIADRLRRTVRATDLLGRWGGEEILLVAPHTDHDAALELAERCRAGIADTPLPGVGRVTASFGVATLVEDDDARSLLRRADLALYTAKRNGRDRVVGLSDLPTLHDPYWTAQASDLTG